MMTELVVMDLVLLRYDLYIYIYTLKTKTSRTEVPSNTDHLAIILYLCPIATKS